MSNSFEYTIKRVPLDEHYHPSKNTRLTTNFANLARGENRQANLRNALKMIDCRFNALAYWDNPNAQRYSVKLEIISVDVDIHGDGNPFPAIEILKSDVVDHVSGERIDGLVGNNLSSYVRDYDFSVVLPNLKSQDSNQKTPSHFGKLHGNLFNDFLNSAVYRQNFSKPPVVCLSISHDKSYRRAQNHHPVLGYEYLPVESSLTELYFQKMGFKSRYFMPQDAKAPLAFYFLGDLLSDYTNLELIATISTMETFQKIYRPEIYNANSAAGGYFCPSLNHSDYSLTQVEYDRSERSQLAVQQGKYTEQNFIKPNQQLLEQWCNSYRFKSYSAQWGAQ